MFALLVEAWAGEPGSWADFPAIRAPSLIICGENEEPHAAATPGWRHKRCRTARSRSCLVCITCKRSGAPAVVPTAHRIPRRALNVPAAGVTHSARPPKRSATPVGPRTEPTRVLAWQRSRLPSSANSRPGPYVYAARASANIRFCRDEVYRITVCMVGVPRLSMRTSEPRDRPSCTLAASVHQADIDYVTWSSRRGDPHV